MLQVLRLQPLVSFQPHVAPSSMGPLWRIWLTRLDNYFLATARHDPTMQQPLLLHLAGEEVFRRRTKTLTKYFSPQVNTDFELFQLLQARQFSDESIDISHARLCHLVSTCVVHDADCEIRAQISGCHSQQLLRQILREPNIPLSRILDLARAYELANTRAQAMDAYLDNLTLQRMHAIFPTHPRGELPPRQPRDTLASTIPVAHSSTPRMHPCVAIAGAP